MAKTKAPPKVSDDEETLVLADDVQAKELDKQIRDKVDEFHEAAKAFHEKWDELVVLVAEAKSGEIHVALDYPSWPAYLVDAIGLKADNIEDRRMCVAFLIGEGLSTRAIADILGVSQSTVDRDARLLGDNAAKTGLDGKQYPPRAKREKPSLTPQLRYTKVYNNLSEQVSRIIDHVSKDDEIAAVATQEVEHITSLRDDLTKLIRRLSRKGKHDATDK